MQWLKGLGLRRRDRPGAAVPPLEGAELREAIQRHYTAVAEGAASCCRPEDGCGAPGPPALYTAEELSTVAPQAAAASAGCGNPAGLADIRPGEVVLDLGSGGGIDCFLAARAAGPEGRVIGIDATPGMVALARQNAEKMGVDNVVFKMAQIETIPELDATIDLIISNCVISLSPNKDAVFRDAWRVLKPGGRMFISDMALAEPLPHEVVEDADEWVACVAGAELIATYLDRLAGAGFESIEVLAERPMPAEPGREWRVAIRSISVKAVKGLD